MDECTAEKIKKEVLVPGATAADAFFRLYSIIRCLRAPGGCPWDREQTPLSMRSDLVEEAFEAVDAVSQQDAPHVREELGDVFLNTAMIAYMHEQSGDFSVADSLNDVSDKIIRRHPHVFPESAGQANANAKKAETAEEVLSQWDNIKRGVEGRAEKSVLDEVAAGLPPLMRAYKMQKKAAKKGFDWNDAAPVYGKVAEELQEVTEAAAVRTSDGAQQLAVEEEIGDLLFSVVNLARHLKVDPTVALTRANEKFRRRFAYVEQKMAAANLEMNKSALEKMDTFWNESKQTGL